MIHANEETLIFTMTVEKTKTLKRISMLAGSLGVIVLIVSFILLFIPNQIATASAWSTFSLVLASIPVCIYARKNYLTLQKANEANRELAVQAREDQARYESSLLFVNISSDDHVCFLNSGNLPFFKVVPFIWLEERALYPMFWSYSSLAPSHTSVLTLEANKSAPTSESRKVAVLNTVRPKYDIRIRTTPYVHLVLSNYITSQIRGEESSTALLHSYVIAYLYLDISGQAWWYEPGKGTTRVSDYNTRLTEIIQEPFVLDVKEPPS